MLAVNPGLGRQMTTSTPNQMLLVINRKDNPRSQKKAEDIYLPPQFCLLTGLPEEMTKRGDLMKSLGTYKTGTTPPSRIDLQNQLSEQIFKSDVMKEWNMEIQRTPAEIDVRRMEDPLVLHTTDPKRTVGLNDKIMKGLPLQDPVALKAGKWLLIYANPDGE